MYIYLDVNHICKGGYDMWEMCNKYCVMSILLFDVTSLGNSLVTCYILISILC